MSADGVPISTRARIRMDRRRQWRRLIAVALIAIGLGVQPGAARACVGDCDGDGTVAINELVLGVNIALGQVAVAMCTAMDANGDGSVTINELIPAVNSALNGCPVPTLTLTGSCAAPGTGSHGLKPCDAGTPITVFRCDDRSQCLHQQGLAMVGATTVAGGGGWSVQVPIADASAALVFQAGIAKSVVYRTLGFGTVSASLRAGQARDVTLAPVDITPVTEAAVQLLDANGFENYSDAGAQEVMTAVEQATATLSFENVTPDMAAALAVQTASADPTVTMVLQTARTRILAFVSNTGSDSVSMIDTASKSVVQTRPFGSAPVGIAATPNGAFVFVANSLSDDVTVLDAASFHMLSTISVDAFPIAVAFSPSGGLAYIVSAGTNTVSVVDAAKALTNPANAVIGRTTAGDTSTGLVVTPDGNVIYLANTGSDEEPGSTLSTIDAEKILTDPATAITGTIPVGPEPTALAITPDGRSVYVTNFGTHTSPGTTVSVVETSSGVVNTLTVGSFPTGVAVSPDGLSAYVANAGNPNSVSVIDTRTASAGQTIPIGAGNDDDPFFVAFTPDGASAYVTDNHSNAVSVIDTATHAVTDTISVGTSPEGVTIASVAPRVTAGMITGVGSATTHGPADITAGPDGNLWVTEPAANTVGRISPAGSLAEFPLATLNSVPTAITAGPDGNLWFTEQGMNKIGRITPAGSVTEFPLPTDAASPTGITSGPDGNLWFTQRGAKRLALITPRGVVSEFPTPGTSDVAPRSITAGSDGTLWFTEPALNQIGSILVDSGRIATYPIPTANSSPAFITFGPGGNLWFTEPGANQIGRITVDGAVREFPIPTMNSQPGAIAAGIDGNLWFTEPGARNIGRITPGGVVTEFPAPTAAFGIATGHDGNLWFTEPSANRVAQISPGLPVTAP